MEESGVYKIRPAGRHLFTIGRDLIQDQYAAVVELVKNAYDADSKSVEITFSLSLDPISLSIIIEDSGHGMSRETVINKWLVPSTDDKQKRRLSPYGRRMQGRKGVGRYAASILGNDLLLETVNKEGEKTTVYIEWDQFSKEEYLDNVDVLVETKLTECQSGTRLTINGDSKHLSGWTQKQYKKLKFELKKLIPPVPKELTGGVTNDQFDINLCFKGFDYNEGKDISLKIEPYPIIDLFDYRIHGKVDQNGSGNLTYINQKARNTITENIQLSLKPTKCGELILDIRVYDREAVAIEQLIGRGLTDLAGNYVGKLEARQLLNTSNGIGVYRNGFRIRPLGDPDFDWLELNKQRVQNPSKKIGSNQAIGYVHIQSEELSNLEEKSARDGLRENHSFLKLKEITLEVINKLEDRRFQFRRSEGLSRSALKVERELEKLFQFDEIKKGIKSKLLSKQVDRKTVDEIITILSKKEDENNLIAEDIRKAVAVYQGQATLGKIINVVLHEGRRPLNVFKNQIPNLEYWIEKIIDKYERETLDDIISITGGIGRNAKAFVDLFSRLDPLAAKKRTSKKEFLLSDELNNSFSVFEHEFKEKGISFEIDCNPSLKLYGWEQDIQIIILNLIDNSQFWMLNKNSKHKHIQVFVNEDKGKMLNIDYKDFGPGIETNLIETEVIFEPEFTTKPGGGTGLGLAIAGEAATRNGLELKAFESETGAYFRLQPIEGKNNGSDKNYGSSG